MVGEYGAGDVLATELLQTAGKPAIDVELDFRRS